MNAPLPMITLRQVGKSFGAHRVLRDINLEVHRGEVLGIYGLSSLAVAQWCQERRRRRRARRAGR